MNLPSDMQSTMDPLDRNLMEMLIRPDGRTFVENGSTENPAPENSIPTLPIPVLTVPAVVPVELPVVPVELPVVPIIITTPESGEPPAVGESLVDTTQTLPLAITPAIQEQVVQDAPGPATRDVVGRADPSVPSPPSPALVVSPPVTTKPATTIVVPPPVRYEERPPAAPSPATLDVVGSADSPPPSPPRFPEQTPVVVDADTPAEITEEPVPTSNISPETIPKPDGNQPTGTRWSFMNRIPLFGNRQVADTTPADVPLEGPTISPTAPTTPSIPDPAPAPTDQPPPPLKRTHAEMESDQFAQQMHKLQNLATMVREISVWNSKFQYSAKTVTIESPEQEIIYLHAIVKSGWDVDQSRNKKRKLLSGVTKVAQLGFDHVSSQFNQPIKMDQWQLSLNYEINEEKSWDQYLDPIEFGWISAGVRPEYALIGALGYSFAESFMIQRKVLNDHLAREKLETLAREEERAARQDSRVDERIAKIREEMFAAQQHASRGSGGSRRSRSRRSRHSERSSSDGSTSSESEQSQTSSYRRRQRQSSRTTTQEAFQQFTRPSPMPPATIVQDDGSGMAPPTSVLVPVLTPDAENTTPTSPVSSKVPESVAATPRRIKINRSHLSTPVRV